MTQILQVAHHPEVHRVPEVEIGGSAINAELDAKAPTGGETGLKILAAEDLICGAAQVRKNLALAWS